MITIRIAGVPEHFNLPWHLALEDGSFKAAGLDVKWTDVPEGTGKMCQMLRDDQTDVAVILTEGIVRDIVLGNPSKIVQVYVQTPLLWGIHVAAASAFETVEDLREKTAAISRPGSGSQLMAYVNAARMGWQVQDLTFKTVHTIEGAVAALTHGEADYFMWERFMTKPLVDNGIFRRLDDCPTPWPCFVIAVTDAFLEAHPKAIAGLLKTINATSRNFKDIPKIERELARRFNQKETDIVDWLSRTCWSTEVPTADMLNNVQKELVSLSLIPKMGTFAEIAKAL